MLESRSFFLETRTMDASEEEPRGKKRKLSLTSCDVCEAEEAKYRCPNCLRCSCSLPCVKQHKLQSGCSGVRNRTAFIPLTGFNDLHLLSDYRFLEETGRVADRPKRDTMLHTRSYPKHRLILLVRNAKAAKVDLKFLPKIFSRHRENTSIYNKKEKKLYWFLKLVFPQSSVEYTNRVPEDQVLEKILNNYIHPTESDPVKQQSLKTYLATPLHELGVFLKSEQRLPNSPKFIELDVKKTLRENLMFKTVVEYPELHVVVGKHCEEYRFRIPDRSITLPHLSTSSKAQLAPETLMYTSLPDTDKAALSELEEGEIRSEDEENTGEKEETQIPLTGEIQCEDGENTTEKEETQIPLTEENTAEKEETQIPLTGEIQCEDGENTEETPIPLTGENIGEKEETQIPLTGEIQCEDGENTEEREETQIPLTGKIQCENGENTGDKEETQIPLTGEIQCEDGENTAEKEETQIPLTGEIQCENGENTGEKEETQIPLTEEIQCEDGENTAEKEETQIPLTGENIGEKEETQIPLTGEIQCEDGENTEEKEETQIPLTGEIQCEDGENTAEKEETQIPLTGDNTGESEETQIPLTGENIGEKEETQIPLTGDIQCEDGENTAEKEETQIPLTGAIHCEDGENTGEKEETQIPLKGEIQCEDGENTGEKKVTQNLKFLTL